MWEWVYFASVKLVLSTLLKSENIYVGACVSSVMGAPVRPLDGSPQNLANEPSGPEPLGSFDIKKKYLNVIIWELMNQCVHKPVDAAEVSKAPETLGTFDSEVYFDKPTRLGSHENSVWQV